MRAVRQSPFNNVPLVMMFFLTAPLLSSAEDNKGVGLIKSVALLQGEIRQQKETMKEQQDTIDKLKATAEEQKKTIDGQKVVIDEVRKKVTSLEDRIKNAVTANVIDILILGPNVADPFPRDQNMPKVRVGQIGRFEEIAVTIVPAINSDVRFCVFTPRLNIVNFGEMVSDCNAVIKNASVTDLSVKVRKDDWVIVQMVMIRGIPRYTEVKADSTRGSY